MSEWLEATFSNNRPRALAALTRYFRDMDLAEEAFSDACLKAVTAWEGKGAPRDPLAWLLTTARNAGLDRVRKTQRHRVLLQVEPSVLMADEDPLPDPDDVRDDVLRLLFICCHPALSRQDQIALALRIVAGLSVAEIARGFLVATKTMEQRVTRAKKKIATNRIAFETPSPQERGRRLGEVSLMVYLMFNEGWSTSNSAAQMRVTLCEEAIRLARLLADLFAGMGDQIALLSLLLFQHARRAARIDSDGRLVSLEDQDRRLWDKTAIAEAVALLQKSERLGHSGPYRVQAAIAAEHALAPSAQATDWQKIEAHYAALYVIQPTPVVRLNHIAAMAKTRGAEHALKEMETLACDLSDYRWYHTMQGGLFLQSGLPRRAVAAFEKALTLGPTEPERVVIKDQISTCKKMFTPL
ncbi:sigma-70 family RNA polymerase sigma factor [Roseobacter sp. YSTF-M11]|uniref:Sigma-70 family RNA polymerase sigma factor n=1 Tax=Roseobacter insulae TaxID=2859783 RepID=A0A9X1JZB2_9RHOB|nr:sigma-70 family RNA polymerase sigma factor [Roseobacter insulae]MBW4709095.1 sigma-70 family RNA polymerase sigma factor [Roseobacter insulae]